ncbi:MAG: hypothetical protein RLZZ61_1652, partial [Pseudomonadota bacterium]
FYLAATLIPEAQSVVISSGIQGLLSEIDMSLFRALACTRQHFALKDVSVISLALLIPVRGFLTKGCFGSLAFT